MAAPTAPPEERYQLPHPDLTKLVDAANTPELRIDPQAQRMLECTRPYLLTLAELSQPERKLAGLRFNPNNRASGREKYYTTLAIRPVREGKAQTIAGLPKNPRISDIMWSPDGKKVAFVQVGDHESQLWIIDAAAAKARRLGAVQLNGTVGFEVNWMPDSQHLAVLAVPSKPGPEPTAPEIPSGPSIQEHKGGKASARTYQDLLKTGHDENAFEHFLRSQVLLVDSDTGKSKALTGPGLYTRVTPSPDGKYFMVGSLHRPYSYTLQYYSFPTKTEVLDASGKAIRVIRDLPLEENSPPDFDAVREGPRFIHWRSDAPATLFWTETLDGGDARKSVEFREQLYLWSPGQASPQAWLKLANRFVGVDWGDGSHALITEGWWKTRRVKTHLVQPDSPSTPPITLFDRSSEDRYTDPGAPLKKMLPNGRWVLLLGDDGKSLFLSGQGASPEGDRPFLDRFDLESKKATRLFRSEAPYFERPVRLLDNQGKLLLTTRESPDTPPNLCLRNLSDNQIKQFTDFSHPAPQLKGVKKEILRYKRSDGVNLTGTLYTPPGYDPKKDGRLPVFVWAYPGEFKNAAVAGQLRDSPYKFLRPWWGGPLFFVMRGYAVLEDPTFPIIGEDKKEPNDTYVEQLVMDAQAAVDAVVEAGVGDRDRCAIGGHSYGAFTTANLLAHSQIFRAGIARSGAYNRTLTPFGFQSEERNYWEARDIYTRMSPFTYADKIDEPLLLIHGAEDSNPGTFPVQSERLYQAIKGLGGQARLVMLPKESHGYAARESVLHTLYEMDSWLEKHVKNAPPRSSK